MAWIGPAILAGGLIGSSAINQWGGSGGASTVKQQPLQTGTQQNSQELLYNFGQTGITPWGYNINQNYTGPLGNYNMTPQQTQGLGLLSSTLAGGTPAIFNSGTNTLGNLLNTNSYDPNNDGGVYAGLTAGIDYNTKNAVNATNQAEAIQGNLYSTNQAKNVGNIETQAANAKSGILAGLYQNFSNQKLAGATSAINAGVQQQNLDLAQVASSQQYGGLAQTLANSQAKDAYQAWLNQQSAELAPISALSSLSGQNAQWGIPSVTGPNPWAQLLQTAAQIGGFTFGNQSKDPTQVSTTGTPLPLQPVQPTTLPYGPAQNMGYYPQEPTGGFQ